MWNVKRGCTEHKDKILVNACKQETLQSVAVAVGGGGGLFRD